MCPATDVKIDIGDLTISEKVAVEPAKMLPHEKVLFALKLDTTGGLALIQQLHKTVKDILPVTTRAQAKAAVASGEAKSEARVVEKPEPKAIDSVEATEGSEVSAVTSERVVEAVEQSLGDQD